MENQLFDTKLINIDTFLIERKQAVLKIAYFRYVTGIVSALLFLIFRDFLPFPYPHVIFVCILFLVGNSILHIISIFDGFKDILEQASPFYDIAFVPLVLYCSGGFISPFIVVFIITAVSVSIMYPDKQVTIRNIYLFLIINYTGISLLQQFGVLANHVEYSRRIMTNQVFFYLVIFMTNCVIGICYFILKKMSDRRHVTLNALKHAYENVVKGITEDVGQNLFQRLVLHLADALQTRCVCIGKVDKKETSIVPITVWDGEFITTTPSIPIAGSVFEKVLQQKKYFCASNIEEIFPDDRFLTLFDAESFYGITLFSNDGKPIGVICTTHDSPMITDYIVRSVFKIFASRAAAEIERMSAEEESKLVHEQLAQAQKLEALGQLAGGIAHDFNNILNGIMGYSQLLQIKLGKDSPVSNYPDKIIALSKKASALTSQLLTFARKGKYHLIPVDIHRSISEVVSMLEHTIDKSISIRQKLKSKKFTVVGDPSQLENMFINLSVNARDAMPDGGELTLGTEQIIIDEEFIKVHSSAQKCKPGDYIKVFVADTGKGMDDKTMVHIFEPFFTTKKQGKGTGLGLAAVYGCVENHGGFIEVKSKIGVGSAFKVFLPLSKKEEPARMDTQTFVRAIKGRGAYLLLVDDEEDILESLSEALTLYGYSVKTCQDGKKAIEYFKESFSEIDLVILDMNMPKMSGRQVFDKMKKIDPSVSILISTGYTLDAEAQKLISEAGVIDLIHKPYRPDRLVRVIEKNLTDKPVSKK